MKQITLTIISIMMLAFASAQSIPNGDFEHWTSFNFNEPDGWYTSNTETIHANEWITAIPIQGYGAMGHGIRIMTDGQNGRTMPGYFTNTLGDPMIGQGGVPYHQRPAYLTGYARYHTLYNDSAMIVVVFKKQGNVIGQNVFKFHGQELEYTPFNMLLTLSDTPDTVIVAATSSNVLNQQVMQTGSFLELDNLEFGGREVNELLPNGDLDNWTPTAIHHAQGWRSEGRHVDWTTNTPYGQHAVSLTSFRDMDGHVHASSLRTGDMNSSGDWFGGLPYSEVDDTLRGYYKYISDGEDAGSLSLEMLSGEVSLGGAFYQFYPTEIWTYFEIPLQLNAEPDTLRLQLMSSSYPFDEATDGSTLFIDNLQLTSQPLAISALQVASNRPAYPNPAVALIHVPLPDGFNGDVQLSLFDAQGKMVKSMNYHQAGSVLRLPLDDLSSGDFIYEIYNEAWLYSGKFTKK